MTKESATIFKCDNCEKRTNAIPNIESDSMKPPSTFPYEKGWVYLYKVNGKLIPDKILDKQDQHFCSKKCLLEFVDKLFTKEKVQNVKKRV